MERREFMAIVGAAAGVVAGAGSFATPAKAATAGVHASSEIQKP